MLKMDGSSLRRFSQYNRFFFYLLNGLFTYFASVDIVDTEIKNTDIV